MFHKNESDYRATSQSKRVDITAGVSIPWQSFSLYLQAGRIFTPWYDYERSKKLFKESKNNYLFNGPWSILLNPSYESENFRIDLKAFTGPLLSYSNRLVNVHTDNFRSFPLSSSAKGFSLKTEFASKKFVCSAEPFITNTSTSYWSSPENIMPSEGELTSYGTKIRLSLMNTLLDTISAGISGSLSGGWFKGHDYELEGYTFLQADSLRFQSITAFIRTSLPKGFCFGIQGSVIRGRSPEGHLKLATFSDWTLFDPQDYKYSDADLHYSEIRGTLKKDFLISPVLIRPSIGVSYFKTRLKSHIKQKRIVVNLLPLYTDLGIKDLWNSEGLIISPGLKTILKTGNITLCLRGLQRLPVIFDNEKSDDTETGKSDSGFRGGLELELSGSLAF